MDEKEPDGLDADAMDDALRALFQDEGTREGESALQTIERRFGPPSKIHLRDDLDDPSPVLKIHSERLPETAVDDSRYQVLGEIGRGAVGIVFKGRDKDLGREVALKVLRPDLLDHPEIVQRFVEEAQIEGQLQHPGIVPLYGLGLQPDGRPYFAMKLVKGRTLSAMLAERTAPDRDLRRFLAIFEQLCQAVGYAHSRSVVHRDLKPSNVMVGAFGEVQVVDWGFAKVLGQSRAGERAAAEADRTLIATVRSEAEGSTSVAGSVMGTPAYMPPEQALGRVDDLDTCSDVFALGAILTEILTGKPAYVGEVRDIVIMAAQARLDDAKERLGACGADKALVTLANHCLEPLMGDRPADAGIVAREIGDYLAAVEERTRRAEIEAAEARAHAEDEHVRLAEEKAEEAAAKARTAEEKRKAQAARAEEAKERRRVARERGARTRTRLLSAAALLLVVAGAGTFLVIDGAARGRAEAATRAVSELLEAAARQQAVGDLAAAHEAAKHALSRVEAERLTGAIGEEAQAAVAGLEKAIANRSAAEAMQRREDALIARLEEIQVRRAADQDYGRTDRELRAAFREAGIDVDAIDPKAAGARIRDFTRWEDVVAVLDTWRWFLRKYREHRGADWRRIGEIADAADRREWSRAVRKAATAQDPEALTKMASKADLDRHPLRALDGLAVALGHAGRADAAIELLNRLVTRWPDDIWVHLHLAYFYSRLSPVDWEGEIRHRTAALALRPEFAGVWAHHAEALRHAGEWERAVAAARRAIDLDPESAFAWTELANHYGDCGDQSARATAFERVREICEEGLLVRDPEDGVAWNNLGGAWRVLREYEKAEAAYRRAIECVWDPAVPLSNLGVMLQEQGRIEEAIAAHRKAVSLSDARMLPAMLEELGNALLARGDTEEAVELLQRAVALDPSHSMRRAALATALRLARRFDEAIELLRETRIDVLCAAPVLNRLGIALLEAGHKAESRQAFRDAAAAARRRIARYPNDSFGPYFLGFSLRRLGRLGEAEAALKRTLELDPDHLYVWDELGGIHLARRDSIAAERAYARATQVQPAEIRSWVYLSQARQGTGDSSGALSAARSALDIDERNPAAWCVLSGALSLEGRREEALEAAAKAFELAPDDPRNLRSIGKLHARFRRFDESVKAYRRAAELEPKRAGTWSSLGFHLSLVNRHEEADAAHRKAVALDPESPAILANHAMGRIQAGDFEAAVRLGRRAVEIAPDSYWAVYGLGFALTRVGDHGEAETWIRRAVELQPNNPYARWQLGAIELTQGRLRTAIRNLEAVVHRLGPRLAEPRLTLASCLAMVGEVEDALAIYEELDAHWGRYVGVYSGRGGCRYLQGDLEGALEDWNKAGEMQPAQGSRCFSIGMTLGDLGRYAEARPWLERAIAIGSHSPVHDVGYWRLLLRTAERLAALEPDLEKIRSGERIPHDAREAADFARLLSTKGHFAESLGQYREALRLDPDLPEKDFEAHMLMTGAFAAARCGETKLALDWIRREFDGWKKRIGEDVKEWHWKARWHLVLILNTPWLDDIRAGPKVLELSEEEMEACLDFWAEVEALLETLEEVE